MSRTLAACLAAGLVLAPRVGAAQTDYYNTDGGRPLRIQDAIAVEWRAVELQFAPLAVAREAGGRWRPELEPELAFGILPRTALSFGFPLVSPDRPPRPAPAAFGAFASRSDASRASQVGGLIGITPHGSASRTLTPSGVAPDLVGPVPDPTAVPTGQVNGLAGVHVSLFHQFNMETRIPALAVKADALLPVGPFSADNPYCTLTGIVTRTLSALGPVRVHGNASYTMGDAVRGDTVSRPLVLPAPRWRAGVSVDRAFPIEATLVAVEALAQQSLLDGDPVRWSSGVGVRHQFSPRLVVDMGVLRDLTGPDRAWSVTVGSAVALGLGRRLF
jgi:hypothetical protein